MKNLLIAILIITAIPLNAQPFENNKERLNFTPDQIAELQTKKMTLYLELNEKQQQQILEINKRNANEFKQKMETRKELREKGEKLSSEEFFKRKSSRLDVQIAYQDKMKSILNEKQFETWKKTRARKKAKFKKRNIQKRLRANKHQKIKR